MLLMQEEQISVTLIICKRYFDPFIIVQKILLFVITMFFLNSQGLIILYAFVEMHTPPTISYGLAQLLSFLDCNPPSIEKLVDLPHCQAYLVCITGKIDMLVEVTKLVSKILPMGSFDKYKCACLFNCISQCVNASFLL